MEKEVKSFSNRAIITQSNSLINAKYELTEIQQKLLLLSIAQVDSKNDDEFFRFSLTIAELEKN
jgi:replicase